ncbi:MAG: aldo/keto reductase [Woeseiaceae bacterium]|nr:aldo/keto reductase [Woeseiaceae bacterium]
MRYVRLGKSDLNVSRLGLDCHSLGIVERDHGWDPFSYDGQVFAKRTVRAALDAGINVFDTSPDVGIGRAESLLGKALDGRQKDVFLASRFNVARPNIDIASSITGSLRRLRAERIDILYVHGIPNGAGTLASGLNETQQQELLRLRDDGYVGHLGLLVSDPATALPRVESGLYDILQLQCNVDDGDAADKVLDACYENDIGVSMVKPLAQSTFKSIVDALDPAWSGASAVRECCLKYLLSDRRVHLINVGMRWEHEVLTNTRLVAGLDPALFDSDRGALQAVT